jgi:hypothetical protein
MQMISSISLTRDDFDIITENGRVRTREGGTSEGGTEGRRDGGREGGTDGRRTEGGSDHELL